MCTYTMHYSIIISYPISRARLHQGVPLHKRPRTITCTRVRYIVLQGLYTVRYSVTLSC